MAACGAFCPARRVAAGVSGGADSMALAWLLRGWGHVLAIIVDHGLRHDSAQEAAVTAGRLAEIGVPARVVRVDIPPGGDLGARARAARYGALLGAMREAGLADLLLGHHAMDQAETQVLRARRGSGAAGLAGMGVVAFRDGGRVVRPLLGVEPGRLRATLRGAGIGWAEDPGNLDVRTARGALRRTGVPAADWDSGVARGAAELGLAREVGAGVMLHPAGFARVDGALSAAGWSALVWCLSGREHPPATAGVERLARAGGGTLHGVLVRGGYAMRETPGAAVAVADGAIWDGRFVVSFGLDGAERFRDEGCVVAALGDGAVRFRGRVGMPGMVLRRFPAVWSGGKLLAVPHLDFAAAEYCRSVHIGFRPFRPLAGAAFVPGAGSGVPGDAHGVMAPHVVSSRARPLGTWPGQGLGNAGNE